MHSITRTQNVTVEDALVELDNLDDEVAVWKPEVGDDIVAMVLEYESFASKFEKGKTLQMVTLRTSDGSFQRLVIGQVALRGLFSRLQPKVGESVKLTGTPPKLKPVGAVGPVLSSSAETVTISLSFRASSLA